MTLLLTFSVAGLEPESKMLKYIPFQHGISKIGSRNSKETNRLKPKMLFGQ